MLTHVQPLCAAFDHALAFCGELAKVRGQHRWGNDCSRHVRSCMSSSESEIISCREINLLTYTPGRTRMTLWRRCLWKTPAPPASIQPWINSDQPDYRRHTATGVFFLDQSHHNSYIYLDRKHIPSLPPFAKYPTSSSFFVTPRPLFISHVRPPCHLRPVLPPRCRCLSRTRPRKASEYVPLNRLTPSRPLTYPFSTL